MHKEYTRDITATGIFFIGIYLWGEKGLRKNKSKKPIMHYILTYAAGNNFRIP